MALFVVDGVRLRGNMAQIVGMGKIEGYELMGVLYSFCYRTATALDCDVGEDGWQFSRANGVDFSCNKIKAALETRWKKQ